MDEQEAQTLGATVKSTGADIGWAVCEMRYHGGKVRRAGWNGTYLVFQRGYPEGIPINANTAQATGIAPGTVCIFLPYIMMRTTTGEFVPWLCSQTDLLANDWQVNEPIKTMSAFVPVPEDEARYPGESYMPDQSNNIEAVRKAWHNCREEYTELEAENDQLRVQLKELAALKEGNNGNQK